MDPVNPSHLPQPSSLIARFTKGTDTQRVEVHRDGGSELAWSFPAHVSRLPHDLAHLVVEDGLGISLGFWGLISRGVDVQVRDGHAELVLDGIAVREHPGVDFDDLRRSEEAVAVLTPFGLTTEPLGALMIVTLATPDGEPPDLSPDDFERIHAIVPLSTEQIIRSVRNRLVELDRHWATLLPGEHITVAFPSSTSG
jgi:hypothetical protein